jgi:hypothetical protein
VTPEGNFSLEQARVFDDFPLFYVGEEFDGIPLTAVLREPIPQSPEGFGPETRGQVTIDFLYGSCEPPRGEGGCSLPIDIQIWPACVRNPSLYRVPPPGGRRAARVRGVPAALLESGARLEIQAGRSTVVIWDSRRRPNPRAVAAALAGVNVPVSRGSELPEPAPGALDGTLACR